PVLLLPAAAIILAHNHPSGDTSPSSEDVELTRRLRNRGGGEAGCPRGCPASSVSEKGGTMKTVRAFRRCAKRASSGLADAHTKSHTAARKWWRRSWSGRVAWPWADRERRIGRGPTRSAFLHTQTSSLEDSDVAVRA